LQILHNKLVDYATAFWNLNWENSATHIIDVNFFFSEIVRILVNTNFFLYSNLIVNVVFKTNDVAWNCFLKTFVVKSRRTKCELILFYEKYAFNLFSFLIDAITLDVFLHYNLLCHPVNKDFVFIVFLLIYFRRETYLLIWIQELLKQAREVFVNFMKNFLLEFDVPCPKHFS
jgi:hypothetical protein